MNEFAMRRNYGPTPNFPLVVNYKRKDPAFISIGGPCSVESADQIKHIAEFVAKNGATHLRGGVFRAGTYPGKNFGYVEEKLIKAYSDAAKANGLKNIIEVLDYSDRALTMVNEYCDCVQVGARSQQNYTLLRKLAGLHKPVFLKRNPGSTLDEWLGSAEHILTAQAETGGTSEVVLIERGSSSYLTHVRWDLSISIIPAIKEITEMPVIVDASHGTGRSDLVFPMTLAGVAAGAAGCLVEVHPDPKKSLSDSDQAIGFHEYEFLMKKVNAIKGVTDAMYRVQF